MRIDEINERLAEIRAMMDAPGYDDTQSAALLEEARKLNQEKAEIEARASHTAELRRMVDPEAIGQINRQQRGAQPAVGPDSEEYRRAWLKNMAVRNGVPLLGEMSKEERAAFMATTANTPAVVPTATMNRIIELVESMAPMYNDASISGMSQGFSIPRHKATTQGDAKGVAEGTANDDEQDTFDLLTLAGVEIKKHVVISYSMQFRSLEAFETWLVNHLAQRIAVAKEKLILARLDGTAPDGGTAVADAGIDTGNVLTAQTYADATIRAIFAKLEGQGSRVIYANAVTIWNGLVGITDADGHKLFVPNSMDDPIVTGRIYGATVKLDNNLADNVAYFGVRGKLLANNFDDMRVLTSVEPKTLNQITTAGSIFDAGLENPKSYVKATFKAGG